MVRFESFHKTTIKKLAEEAGLSHGNVYDYVASKEDIFFLIHDFLAGWAMDIPANKKDAPYQSLAKIYLARQIARSAAI